jgi:hypothetical protein
MAVWFSEAEETISGVEVGGEQTTSDPSEGGEADEVKE